MHGLYQIIVVARNKGDKDYTTSEKQILISLIIDYSIFRLTDYEMVQMLSTKIGIFSGLILDSSIK